MKTMSLWRLYVHNKISSKNVYILKQQTQTLLTSPLNVANEQFSLLRWTIPFFEYLSFKWANSGRGFTPTKTLSFSESIWDASALESMVVPLLPFFPFSNFLWFHRLKITHTKSPTTASSATTFSFMFREITFYYQLFPWLLSLSRYWLFKITTMARNIKRKLI